jgi:hypothetical protein
MSKRQKVHEVCWFESLPCETSLVDCIGVLLFAQKELLNSNTYTDLTVEVRNDQYETGLAIYGSRDETDAEFKQRLKRQSSDRKLTKKEREERRERDLKLYQKLKKRFEKEEV